MMNAFDKRVVLTGCASNTELIRMPYSVIEKVPHLESLSKNTSGMRIRFKSNTNTIRIVSKNEQLSKYTHLAMSACSGFDIYVNRRFSTNIRPAYGTVDMDETVVLQTSKQLNIIDIYFPLYNSVTELFFELDKGALIEKTKNQQKPVLFYGSSITQGGCASRPGNSYVNMLSLMMDRSIINLGFSGSAKGEMPVADYIASLDLAAFIYDYDHNAPDTKWLSKTHEPFFKRIRSIKPDLPIIMMSRPGFERWADLAKENNIVVMTTYLNAYKAGDRNVHYIDGRSLFGGSNRDRCTVDGTHPNDIGFERMAETILPVLKNILEG